MLVNAKTVHAESLLWIWISSGQLPLMCPPSGPSTPNGPGKQPCMCLWVDSIVDTADKTESKLVGGGVVCAPNPIPFLCGHTAWWNFTTCFVALWLSSINETWVLMINSYAIFRQNPSGSFPSHHYGAYKHRDLESHILGMDQTQNRESGSLNQFSEGGSLLHIHEE